MIIPNTPVSATIVKKDDNSVAIRIRRIARKSFNNVYDLTAESLFDLVDKKSNGRILDYVDYTVIGVLNLVAVSHNSVNKLAEFVYNNFTKEELNHLFGNIHVTSVEDMKSFFGQCSFYSGDDFDCKLSDFIFEKYAVLEGKVSRKN